MSRVTPSREYLRKHEGRCRPGVDQRRACRQKEDAVRPAGTGAGEETAPHSYSTPDSREGLVAALGEPERRGEAGYAATGMVTRRASLIG
jgi:hypothetical protein